MTHTPEELRVEREARLKHDRRLRRCDCAILSEEPGDLVCVRCSPDDHEESDGR